ncbi:hypothetical protein [Microbacterium sp. Root180]|uniref:hypothetical protein n=1 Tax=Microbacterium sp. Root180 TaxID=1736483 RepID=UPI0006F846BA|nr:hypothetical protein [Microbacterium sp. Root180]KRB38537.1 hypothetical protein ASD93_00765 [Microbacterium sp. Root180]
MTESATVPAPTGFHIMMPPGWVRYLVDEEGKRALITQTSARMRELSRPDLDAQARTLVEAQWRRLVQTGVTAIYLPTSSDEVLPPASIAVRQHVAKPGVDFDGSVRATAGAAVEAFDTRVGRILRWRSEAQGAGDLSSIRTRQVGYAFAMPGHARRGLVFVAAIPFPDGADPAMIEAMTEMCDTIMETFRWR